MRNKITIFVILTIALLALVFNHVVASGGMEYLNYLSGGQTLTVSQGGTGATSFTAGKCLKGNGTGAITTIDCGSGGSGGVGWASTTQDILIYNTNGSDGNPYKVLIQDAGVTATTSNNILNVIGSADFSGRVGIGTTSPYAKLSVAGPVVAESFNATSTIATSTLAGPISINSIFNIGNNRIRAWADLPTNVELTDFFLIEPVMDYFQSGNNYGFRSIYNIETPATTTTQTWANGAVLGQITIPDTNDNIYSNRQSGLYGYIHYEGTGQLGDARGTYSIVGNYGSGQITRAYGVYSNISLVADSTGDISTAYSFFASSPTSAGTGVIGTNYGLYIDNQVATGVNTSYAIYATGTAQSILQGRLTIGTSTVDGTEKFNVLNGNISLENNHSLKIKDTAGTYRPVIILDSNDNLVIKGRDTVSDIQIPSSSGITIKASNVVGIGDATPQNKLSIVGGVNIYSATGNSFDTAAPTAGLLVEGNTGIGTSSPYAKLSVVGEIVGAKFTATTTATSTLPRLSATGVSTDWFCLTGDTCRTTWPTGGSGSGGLVIADTPAPAAGFIPVFDSTSTSTAIATSTIFIKSNGFIGIGTTTPSFQLHIVGDSPNFVLDRYSNDASPAVQRGRKARGTVNVPSAASQDDGLFSIYAGAHNGTAWVTNTGALLFKATQNHAVGSAGTKLDIQTTADGSATLRTVATIDQSGYLGIGTTTPYASLSVNGRGVFNQDIRADYFTATSTTATSTFAMATSSSLSAGVFYIPTLATPAGSFLAINGNGQTIATTSPVPYSGASGTINLNNQLLTNVGTIDTDNFDMHNSGMMAFYSDSGVTQVGTIYFSGAGIIGTESSGSTAALLDVSGVSNKTFTFPDKALTFAGINNETFTGLTILANASTTQLTVTGSTYLATTSGNVGIGTTTPETKLEIYGGDVTIGYQKVYGIRNSVNNIVGFGTVDNGTIGPNAAKLNVFKVGYSSANGWELGGTQVGIAGSIAAGNVNIISFQTNTLERIRIDASGNLGIGTTSPYARLSVEHLSTTGTVIGTDALTGFTGNLLDLKVASTSKFTINGSGLVTAINASTTAFSAVYASSTESYISGRQAISWGKTAFGYSTSTAWTASSTLREFGTAIVNEVWVGAYCHTDTGTANALIGNGTASTTINLTTANTYTDFADITTNAGAVGYYQFGTPASSPTDAICTIKKYFTSN